jgi:hypothetical protein
MAKTLSVHVATGTAHKLKLDESAENSQHPSGTACMARNVAQRNQ